MPLRTSSSAQTVMRFSPACSASVMSKEKEL